MSYSYSYTHNPYAYSVVAPEALSSESYVPQTPAMCYNCRDTSVQPGEYYCSRRCAWSACSQCPQCGRSRQYGAATSCGVYCTPSCAREASHANWCPQCGVRQLASNVASCVSCGYIPVTTLQQRPQRAEPHRVLDPSEKEYKALMKQWHAASGPRNKSNPRRVVSVVKLGTSLIHRKRYLAYRAQVDGVVQQSGCAKYLHGGEGNELRRFYPTNLACEFGTRGLGRCGNSRCGVCSVVEFGTCVLATPGYSNTERCFSQGTANAMTGLSAMLVCRVVVGNADHTSLTPTSGHHSSVLTFTDSPMSSARSEAGSIGSAEDSVSSRRDPTQHRFPASFFPASVDDAIYVTREDAVDPVYVVICA